MAQLSTSGRQRWQEKIKSRFTDRELLDIKQKLLAHLQHQDIQGKETDRYYFQGTYLCLSVFCSLTRISRHVALKVLTDFAIGVYNYTHGNFGVRKPSLKTDKFTAWMKSFLYLYSQVTFNVDRPNQGQTWLILNSRFISHPEIFHLTLIRLKTDTAFNRFLAFGKISYRLLFCMAYWCRPRNPKTFKLLFVVILVSLASICGVVSKKV